MELQKHMTNETTGISYTLNGDYYLPNLTLPEETQPIGICGQRHLRYIKEHKRVYYSILLTSGKLNSYLADIDKQAEDMFAMLVEQMAEHEGITEQLKEENQLEWIQQMNSIRVRAIEIVNAELNYM
ncbi:MAG: TnpV protein [Faecalibacterium sp.]|nr:TnpV protein [Ruminococcus flavefaciens]MCM1392041.1 TnpV protein [Ruminococcus sp.]MCM1484848.1 TnpV protein [Faecalibacterium sp.]